MSNERSAARGPDEVEIAGHELEHRRLQRSSRSGCASRHRVSVRTCKRRPVILRARPSGEIERSIRIDAGFGQHRLAEHRRDLVVGPHILQEGGLNLLPEMPADEEARVRPACAALG